MTYFQNAPQHSTVGHMKGNLSVICCISVSSTSEMRWFTYSIHLNRSRLVENQICIMQMWSKKTLGPGSGCWHLFTHRLPFKPVFIMGFTHIHTHTVHTLSMSLDTPAEPSKHHFDHCIPAGTTIMQLLLKQPMGPLLPRKGPVKEIH